MSKIVNVSNLTELYKALSQATGGETIQLAGGDYGKMLLAEKSGFNLTFPSNVTITSADPNNPAVFTGLDIRYASNLTFDGLVFDYTFQEGHPISLKPFLITGGDHITVRNSTFDGDLAHNVSADADGLGYAFGLTVQGTSNAVVDNNEFFNFYRGLVMGGGTGSVISNNEMYSIRMDGMNFAQVQDILIEGNYLHDFTRSTNVADHADMIQFWTNNTTKPSVGITIRGNVLDLGDGGATQSIFMRNDLVDRGLAGVEMYYQNVLIENNVIYNGHTHGITVGETTGLIIRNNSVLHSDGGNPDGLDAGAEIPRINVAGASTNVQIIGNAVASISGWSTQADWVVHANAFIQDQDPKAAGYYGDVFIGSSLNSISGAHHFVALPGGMLDVLNAGSSFTAYHTGSERLDAQFHIAGDADNSSMRHFNALLTTSPLQDLPVGTKFLWDFGDGTTASGATVAHSFATGGYYDVRLIVQLPDGTIDMESARVGIEGPQVVSLGSSGNFIAYDHGTAIELAAAAMGSTEGVQLGTQTVAATIAREHISELFMTDNFDISLRLQADQKGSAGEVFRLHSSFIASVTSTGELLFQLFTTSGEVKVTTSGAAISDLAAHDIDIRLEGGQLQVFIDDTLNGSADVHGAMADSGTSGLFFGNPWGKPNFYGDLKAFEITVDSDDYTGVSSTSTSTPPPTDPLPEAPVTEIIIIETPPPVQEPTPTPPPPAETITDSGMHDADWSGLIIDPARMLAEGTGKLMDDAKIAQTTFGTAIVLDGKKDYVDLGRVLALESSDRVGFSVDFARDTVTGGENRLIWNHSKIGLTLSGDGIIVQVATVDEGFKAFKVGGLGLKDTDLHNAEVMLDAKNDRLQVVVDDKVVLDVADTDFNIVGAGDREWGWSIGTAWNRYFDGAVTDFRLGDRFEFLDGHVTGNEGSLV